MTLSLKNPHSVLEALKTRPQDVLEVLLPGVSRMRNDEEDTGWSQVEKIARQQKIKVSYDKNLSRGLPIASAQRTASAEAKLNEKESVSIEELFKPISRKKPGNGLWLALDQVQDPQNVGSIFRSAAFFGVEGIIMTKDRASSMTSAVYDVASGGVERVPFCIHSNLQRAFEVAKDAGLWILGSSEHASHSYKEVKQDRSWLLVLGNEEKGMRRLTEEACDQVCSVPAFGSVGSLNVAVASGILISHLS